MSVLTLYVIIYVTKGTQMLVSICCHTLQLKTLFLQTIKTMASKRKIPIGIYIYLKNLQAMPQSPTGEKQHTALDCKRFQLKILKPQTFFIQ